MSLPTRTARSSHGNETAEGSHEGDVVEAGGERKAKKDPGLSAGGFLKFSEEN